MELAEILRQPEGFTPPEVTVKIEKVYDYKSGEGENGPWSFQDVAVVGGGRLKLKGIKHAFPKDREGMTVTIRANQSRQHGLTGMKVAHEQYQGKTYDKLVITSSAKWEYANPATVNNATALDGPGYHTTRLSPPSNGGERGELTYQTSDTEAYMGHLFGCAALAGQVAGLMKVNEDTALQACFATICIDTKNRGILLPKPSSNGHSEPEQEESHPFGELPDVDEDIPF